MDYSQHYEDGKRTGHYVSAEYHCKYEERKKIQRFPLQGVKQVAGKRPYRQGCYRIAGEYDSDHAFAYAEFLYQIERKDGHEEEKAEIQQEVGQQYETVIT